MPGSVRPEKYLRWRVRVGDPGDRRHRRWPLVLLGSGLTEVPDGGTRAGRRRRPAGPWHQVFVGRMAVTARSVDRLRRLLDHPVSLARVRRVTVAVEDWRIPQRGWSGRLGPLPHLLTSRVGAPHGDRGRMVVEIEVRWSVPLRSMLVAILPLLTPVRPMPTPGGPEVTAQDVFPDWLGAGPRLAVTAGELTTSDDIRPYDIVLRPDGAAPGTAGGTADPPYRAVFPVGRHGAASRGGDGSGGSRGGRTSVLVDLEHAVPVGRYGPFGPATPRAELTFSSEPDGRDWWIVGPDGAGRGGRLDRPWLTEEIGAALDGIGVLDCRAVPGRYPEAEATLLLHLVLAGVLVHAPGLPPACAAPLADELVELLGRPLPDRPGASSDRYADLEWEARAVRQRRAAMRGHGREFVLPRLAAGAFPGFGRLPSVSALLVTRRLAYVLDAVAAIEAQSYPELEIVLCLHGVGLPADLRARLAGCTRQLEIVEVPAGQSFGEAVGAATARARGSLVTKFDDDDTYGPEHVWDLVLARHHSGATLVGKPAEFVYLQTLDTTVRRDAGAPESFAPVVAGGTMLIGRGDLEQVGGWRPVPRSVDRGLLDRVRRAGGLIYRTHPLGYVYQRRSAGHTWDPGLEYFLRDAGAQWPGLPRHPEFGTGPAPATAPARSTAVSDRSSAVSDRFTAVSDRSSAAPAGPVPSSRGPAGPVLTRVDPVRPPRVDPARPPRGGAPASTGAGDEGSRRRGGGTLGHRRLL
ncbi:glycosyltransferase [Plantactinospora sp. S1510]|uniref:Glycosyltransferase n=1 Tax=Plantactinospora alkalitolerans TaxID=2789879 RepID=A0ABS0GVI0_9ACTN|nr:glycosyltransferase [Plantactinospora alkalitolerans]MBF9130195.1 glycosyltransferase [Plantactinospora alkalitolerans]